MEDLKTALFKSIQMEEIDSDQSMVTNIRHYEGLKNTKDALSEVVNAINMGMGGDLLSIDIKNALHHLGEITGEITTR